MCHLRRCNVTAECGNSKSHLNVLSVVHDGWKLWGQHYSPILQPCTLACLKQLARRCSETHMPCSACPRPFYLSQRWFRRHAVRAIVSPWTHQNFFHDLLARRPLYVCDMPAETITELGYIKLKLCIHRQNCGQGARKFMICLTPSQPTSTVVMTVLSSTRKVQRNVLDIAWVLVDVPARLLSCTVFPTGK